MSFKKGKPWKSPVRPAAIDALVLLHNLCENAKLTKHSHPLIMQIHKEFLRLEYLLMKKEGRDSK